VRLNKQDLDHGQRYTKASECLPCPFCGEQPTIQPWHGDGPGKRLVACVNEDCHIEPSVTGLSPAEARRRWNSRP
jgi:hypothetical protein